MAKEDMVGTMKKTELEKNLGSTIIKGYSALIDDVFLQNAKGLSEVEVGDGVGNFALPTLKYLLHLDSSQRNGNLNRAYLKKLESIMFGAGRPTLDMVFDAQQSALFDDLMFGINMETGKMSLYTLNFKLLGLYSEDESDIVKKCLELNEKGILHAYRIDVEYYSEQGFSFKAVKLNKNTHLDPEKFELVPYYVVQRYMAKLSELMESGGVYRFTQDTGGTTKVRYLTENKAILAKYCDSPDAVQGIKGAYFPLAGFFYLPCLGAPSTTAMVSRVNLLDLTQIVKVPSNAKLPVNKVEDPLRDQIMQSQILSEVHRLSQDGFYELPELLEKLPRADQIIDQTTLDLASAKAVSSAFSTYLNSLKAGELKKAYSLFPAQEKETARLMEVMKESRTYTGEVSKESLQTLLKESICSILIRKKDCTLSRIICTNSTAMLRWLYGIDYVSKYESFSYRFFTLVKFTERYGPEDAEKAKEMFSLSGIPYDKKMSELLARAIVRESKRAEGDRLYEDVKKEFCETYGVKYTARTPEEYPSVAARRCFATITENGPENFHVNVDPAKVVSIQILS